MKILIAGGSGFLGRRLTQSYLDQGHEVMILTRGSRVLHGARPVKWDVKSTTGWGHLVNDVDVMFHLAGKSLASWPWTVSARRAFYDSRVGPGLLLAEAVQQASRPPKVFVQQSGINYYGLSGTLADEGTPAGNDFLAQLAVEWENATATVEARGVRRLILRTAVVLARREGLFPLLALPARLFFGGPIGSGKQAMPWIHIDDWIAAVRFLIEKESTRGVYNLISPDKTSNSEFVRSLAGVLHRPYWFRSPAFLLRNLSGGMSVLVLEGRYVHPARLLEAGYKFRHATPRDAFLNLFEG